MSTKDQKNYPSNTIVIEDLERTRDLGFGSIVAKESRQRLLNQDGSFNVQRKGLRNVALRNLYHWLLTMPWSQFLGFVIVLYLGINLAFAVLYVLIDADALVDTSSLPIQNDFVKAFFFSVHTFGTIGYGTISPIGTTANILVTFESIVSILLQALVTGMFFARFSRPVPRIEFSNKAVVAPYQDGKGLMFRLANFRTSQLIEVEAKVFYARFVEENGRVVRKFDLLSLERKKIAFFPLSWTVVHPIDERSPFYMKQEKDLRESDAEILILLTAVDESFSQVVHARSSYKYDEIEWDAKFVNLYNEMGTDEPISINVHELSEIEKI